jgi:hypothetical protein
MFSYNLDIYIDQPLLYAHTCMPRARLMALTIKIEILKSITTEL